MADEKEYYSVPEFAKELGVSRIAIFKRVKKGKIRAIRIGRNWAIPADELVSLLAIKNLTAENTMKGQSHAGLAMPSPPAFAALVPVETADGNKELCSLDGQNVIKEGEGESDIEIDDMDDLGWD